MLQTPSMERHWIHTLSRRTHGRRHSRTTRRRPVGITVPDMEQAHAFFMDVLGFDYVYSLPEMRHDDDWMLHHLNVGTARRRAGDPDHPLPLRPQLRGLRVRAPAGPAPAAAQQRPGRSDPTAAPSASRRGLRVRALPASARSRVTATWAATVALYVDDMDRPSPTCAPTACGCSPGRSRAATPRPGSAGSTSSARGAMQFELVSFPAGKAYESGCRRQALASGPSGGMKTRR